MDGFQFIDIILLAMVAGFLILRLRSTLGRRTGHEQGQENFSSKKVVRLSKNDQTNVFDDENQSLSESKISTGLNEILEHEPNFNMDEFKEGALKAFEMIINAFAKKDIDSLSSLLSDQVLLGFKKAIKEYEDAGEVLETEIVKVNLPEILQVNVTDSVATISVRFESDQINLIKSEDGDVIEGDPNQIESSVDEWTFQKNLSDQDPNWELAKTSTPS
jgi:predicted lipid-binding transport protein (Tim44 family)